MQEHKDETEKTKFSIEINNVFRDFFQGLYANRIPLDDKQVLEIYSLWNKLVKLNATSEVKFGTIEAGGAQPQVDAVYLNKDPLETWRQIRAAAPDTAIRPLERATNVFMLKPSPIDEIKYVLKELAFSTAGKHLRDHKNPNKELLRVKIFDSQAILKEVEPVVEIIKNLRKDGYPIGVEIAIPYSNGQGLEPNPYDDGYFVNKFIEAAQLKQKYNIPDESFHISLKDMGGELSAANAERLTRKIITGLKYNNLNVKFGLHLHDTGLATDAYAAAIRVCHEEEWPISIDTVESAKTAEAALDESYANTGFAACLPIFTKLQESLKIDLSDAQKELLQRIGGLVDKVADDYKLARKDSILTGEELRKYKIPGGGFASFVNAVASLQVKLPNCNDSQSIVDALNITQKEALDLAGSALIAVGRIMGQPFAVTPGFQNKQIAALNLLKNMMERGLKHEGIIEEIKDINEVAHVDMIGKNRIEHYFFKGLDQNVVSFLYGKMPAEPHKFVRQKCPIREKLLHEGANSNLSDIRKVAKELQKSGLIKPTDLQLKAAEFYCQQMNPLQRQQEVSSQANEIALRSAIARGIILGGGAALKNSIEKPWLCEPLAGEYKGNADGYALALARFKAGLKLADDQFASLFKQLQQNMRVDQTVKTAKDLLNNERLSVEIDTIDFVLNNMQLFGSVVGQVAANVTNSLQESVAKIYKQQGDVVSAKAQQGERFLYTKEQRIEIALGCFERIVTEALQKDKPMQFSLKSGEWTKLINEAIAVSLKDISDTVVTAPSLGRIMYWRSTTSGLKDADVIDVQKGDVICAIEVMKMVVDVRASKAGKLKIKVASGNVEKGDEIGTYIDREVIQYVERKEENVPYSSELGRFYINRKSQLQKILADQQVENVIVANDNVTHEQKEAKEPQQRNSCYNVPQLGIARDAKPELEQHNVIHIIGNRAGCAAKIHWDLQQAGCKDVRVLYTEGDSSTQLIKELSSSDKIRVKSYTDQEHILATISNVLEKNPGKTVMFHPGWGFLSEKDDFVRKVERLNIEINLNILFHYIEKNIKSESELERLTSSISKVLNISVTPKSEIHARGLFAASIAEKYSDKPDPFGEFLNALSKNPKINEFHLNTPRSQRIVFAGPAAKPMELAGGKFTFREVVKESAPEFNPEYFGNATKITGEKYLRPIINSIEDDSKEEAVTEITAAMLTAYLNAIEVNSRILLLKPENAEIDSIYRAYYEQVKKMGGDVMIKAVYGGGGRGIVPFKMDIYRIDKLKKLKELEALGKLTDEQKAEKVDLESFKLNKLNELKELEALGKLSKLTDEQKKKKDVLENNLKEYFDKNYLEYVKVTCNTIADSERLFHSSTVMTEQCIRGKTQHLEVQFVASGGSAVLLGLRNCTAQVDRQKFAEMNVIEGDYPPALIEKINKAAQNTANALAKGQNGYKGVGTLEMLVAIDDNGEYQVKFLEVNTRLQVEHAVTERDIAIKTGKNISLPVLNAYLAMNPNIPAHLNLLELYNLSDMDIINANQPGKERITHFRINSKYLDLINGSAVPAWFSDKMWPDGGLVEYIAKQTGATIIQGGLGKGNYDPQIGAIYGTEKAVLAAAELLLKVTQLSQINERNYNARTNLDTTLAIYPLMFDKDGKVRNDFTTLTVDELLQGVKDGKKSVACNKPENGLPAEFEYSSAGLEVAMGLGKASSVSQRVIG